MKLDAGPLQWALLRGAAQACGVGRPPKPPPGAPSNAFLLGDTVDPGSDPQASFVFRPAVAVGPSCDRYTAYQETWLCVAQKLEDVASAVTDQVWDIPGLPDLPGPWRLPVQSTRDQFILRDQAIFTLAHLAYTDLFALTSVASGATQPITAVCSDLYAKASKDSAFAKANEAMLFESSYSGGTPPYFPPLPAAGALPSSLGTPAHLANQARARLAFKAHILRASGRLLEKVVRKSVFADLAGAEAIRSRATDPRAGNRAAWGIDAPNAVTLASRDPRYNSLSHAIRVLGGRWELARVFNPPPSTSAVTPQNCAGIAPIALLARAYGYDLDARHDRRPATTGGQRDAMMLIGDAGIVLDPATLVDGAWSDVVGGGTRAVVRTQILQATAVKRGIEPNSEAYDNVFMKGEGEALAKLYDALEDADIRYALGENYAAYRMLTGRPQWTSPSVLQAGLAGVVPSGHQKLGEAGIAAPGALGREQLAGDIMARVGGIQTASQCEEAGGVAANLLADASYRWAFQDSFALAQTIEQRLSAIRDDWTMLGLGDPGAPGAGTTASDVAAYGVAEMRTWAGGGRLVATATAAAGTQRIDSVTLHAVGFSPQEWGVSSAQSMADRVVVVWGEPWVAECAAGLRRACPAGFAESYVASPVSPPVVEDLTASGKESLRRAYGAEGSVVSFTFQPGTPASFVPLFQGTYNASQRLYVVLKNDPKAPSSHGKVLGALTLRRATIPTTSPTPTGGPGTPVPSGTATPVSPMQVELYNAVLGFDKTWASTGGAAIGKLTPNFSKSYCIDGPSVAEPVPYDLFVPLENELTSDSDQYENSWRHYLTVAKSAAQHADELGRQMIDIGMQRELRREAAGEEVGKLCGVYGNLDDVSIDHGKVKAAGASASGSPTGADAALASCLSSDKKDIVFLSQDPYADLDDKAATDAIRKNVLHCGAAGVTHPLCNDDPKKPAISHAALNLVGPAKTKAGSTCQDVALAAQSLHGKFIGANVSAAANKEYMDPGSLEALARSLSLLVRPDGTWALHRGGAPILDASPTNGGNSQTKLWPGCRLPGPTGEQQCEKGAEAAAINLDRAFRRGTPGKPIGTTDGTAEEELQAIRWRIEGALWQIAVMAGVVPKDLFKTSVAAARLDVFPAQDPTPVVATYGDGVFALVDPATDLWRMTGTGLFSAKSNAEMNAARDGRTPAPWFGAANPELPAGLKSILGDPSRYVAISAGNEEIVAAKDPNLATTLSVLGNKLNGMRCDGGSGLSRFHGDPSEPDPAFEEARSAVTKMRMARQCIVTPGEEGSCAFEFAEDSVFRARNTWVFDESGCAECGETLGVTVPGEDTNPGANLRGYLDSEAGHKGTCETGAGTQLPLVRRDCLKAHSPDGKAWSYYDRFTTAGFFPPSKRVRAFVNSYPPNGACGAAAVIAQAMTLACEAGGSALVPSVPQPPPMQDEASIGAAEAWVRSVANVAEAQVGTLYLERVPTQVVDQFNAKQIGLPSTKGTHGTLVLQLRGALEPINSGWISIAQSLRKIADAIAATRMQLAAVKLTNGQDAINIAIAHIHVASQLANTVAAVARECSPNVSAEGPSGNPIACKAAASNALIQAGLGAAEAKLLDESKKLKEEQNANSMFMALNALSSTLNAEVSAIDQGLSQVRANAIKALEISSQLDDAETAAQYQAAKGSGADFATIDGVTVEYPVNTALNHQYDLTKLRYEAALRDARYLAFVARRAIEQRIGQQLNRIDVPVGPFEAPSLWANDVCTMSGIDFDKLKKPDVAPGGGGSGGSAGSGGTAGAGGAGSAASGSQPFADPYIGDYVAKLENFVEYYNIKYPSHDGDDVAVLSLREDIIGKASSCSKEAPNRLYFSSRLGQSTKLTEGNQTVVRGWDRSACNASHTACLRVADGTALSEPPPSPDGSEKPTYSWLHDVDPTKEPASGATPPAGATGKPAPGPTRTVRQLVHLEAGQYTLSWWDQARDPNGDLLEAGAAVNAYRAEVQSASWTVVTSFLAEPYVAVKGAAPWSPRHALTFKVTTPGDYYVVLGAVAEDAPISVVVGGLQLEKVTTADGAPGPYYDTAATRLYLSGDCASVGTAADLQGAFEYHCDGTEGCYYELAKPFTIDTEIIAKGGDVLRGKIAARNFNYRHVTLGVNLVGTGLNDCTTTPGSSCYASGYVEYSLNHDAYDVGVVSYDGVQQKDTKSAEHFSFGSASINHAKALASEKYITNPISSADTQLLDQTSITKPELRGRPLDGTYRFRIWDRPGLVWNQLQDVQFVLKYRYWAPIAKQ